MRYNRILERTILTSVILAMASICMAQWSNDPAVNLVVADRPGEQTIPLIGSTSDGGAYIAWFDNASGNYDVYLQRLDAGGGELDLQAYRVSASGAMLWGPDGITLSFNTGFEPAPRVAEASDGNFVFVWPNYPASGNLQILMQRVTPAGTPQFAPGGIPVVSVAGESPAFVEIAASDAGSVILSWVRDTSSFPSPRHVHAEKFSSTGTSVWGSTTIVFDAYSVPIGYYPQILSDGSGGAVFLWHRSDFSLFNSFVQRLDAGGNELWPHNGVSVSAVSGVYHLSPAFSFDPVTKETIVFWLQENTTQSLYALQTQKLSSAGARLCGSSGVNLIPTSGTALSPSRSVGHAGGAMVLMMDSPSPVVDRLLGMRVDSSGSSVWSATPLVVSNAASSKSRYPITIDSAGSVKIVWEDDRSGNRDLYAQNVNADGSLGLPAGAGRIVDAIVVDKSSSTPGDLTISCSPSCSAGALDYAIYEGEIGSYYSHVQKDCKDDGGDRTEEVQPASGDRYYVVVPLGASDEGSYGLDSNLAERPAPASAADRCLANQLIVPCP